MFTSPTQIKHRIFMPLGLPAAFLYALLMFFLKEKFYCLGITDCRVWGSFASEIIFSISSVGLFSLVIADALYRTPIKFRTSKLLAIVFGLFLIIGTIITFAIYTKTTSDYIETKDINAVLSFLLPTRIEWNQVIAAGKNFQGNLRTTNIKYRYCLMFPYIVLNNKSAVALLGAASDYSLIDYLKNNRNLKEAITYNECY